MAFDRFYGDDIDTRQPDKVLREVFFPDYDYKGVYLDVGAGHPFVISNSFHFRMNGWQVYSIDANQQMCEMYWGLGWHALHCGVGDRERTERFFAFDGSNPVQGGGVFAHSTVPAWGTETMMTLRTLNDIMETDLKDVANIDIVDIDIEYGEIDALKGFDLDKYRPRIILVEDHLPDRSGIQQYLEDHNYRLDIHNHYNYFYVRRGDA